MLSQIVVCGYCATVSGERRAIDHPLTVDFSGMAVPPLKFILQTEYSPAGVIERPSPGITTSYSPWYLELACDLTGIDAIAVLYWMPTDDESALLMACLNEVPFFTQLMGADFGDGLTRLTARHWPELYTMLVHSNNRTSGRRVLCKVVTPGRVQWVVADQLRKPQQEFVKNEQLLDLIGSSLQTFLRVSRYLIELPDVFEVVGGPDRTDRRLKAMAGLLGGVGGIGQGLQDGVQLDELLDLAQSARDVVKSLLELKD